MSLYSKTSTDDLWLTAVSDPGTEVFKELAARLKKSGIDDAESFHDKLEMLLDHADSDEDGGGNSRIDPAKAEFFLDLAAMGAGDSATFRKALTQAVRSQLPPYLNKSQFLRSLGIRDAQVPIQQVAKRVRNVKHLKNGAVLFLGHSSQWGALANLNSLTATAGITLLPGGGALTVPLGSVLDSAIFFAPGPEVLKLAEGSRKPAISANDYRALALRKAVNALTEEDLAKIARATLTPKAFSNDEFEAWWKSAPSACVPTQGGRHACDGRSLKEIALLLDAELDAANLPRIDDEQAQKFAVFFENLKEAVTLRETKLLGEVIAKIVRRAKTDQLEMIFAPLVDKAPFWPSELNGILSQDLEVWGDLGTKYLPELAAVTRALYPEEFLAAYAVHLPQRALNIFCDALDKEILDATFETVRFPSADFMMWVWKNRKKMPAPVRQLVSVENVVRALNYDSLPKAWAAGQRDLRTHLMDKADFQQQMIDAAGNVATSITSSLQGANFFMAGERQSLLVKFSRLSNAIREHLESGAGEQMLASAKEQTVAQSQTVEPLFTSPASHRRLLKELDDIINVHQPENREALKTARAHGDFRENSEFDAAKERRNYLSRRRNELERDILRVQAVPFRTVTLTDTAVIGSEVTLTFPDGTQEVYQLLGAWDGDPERNWLSYKTRMGEAIYGHKTGAKLSLPGDRKCVLTAVKPLSDAVLDELD